MLNDNLNAIKCEWLIVSSRGCRHCQRRQRLNRFTKNYDDEKEKIIIDFTQLKRKK